jgi:tRNA (guanine6-N2)-methyltransferase
MTETLCYIMTMPGLETVAFSEVKALKPDATLVKFGRGIALFTITTAPQQLLALRTAEDVYVALAHITGLGRSADALRVLHSATAHADINSVLPFWQRAHQKAPPPRTWRVVSQREGNHDFRRIDAGRAISDALKSILPSKMRMVEDDADVEFWLWLHGSEAIIGLRLSDASMRHRTYKRNHLPASLRPTVAATMALLSQPTDEDRVLDPLCGAGTLLIERALMGSTAELRGGDISPEAVKITKRNLQSAGIDANVSVWDATGLPLDDSSMTQILTNLPFGKQIGAPADNKVLYPALAREFRRVLASNGIMVSLTSDDRLWDAVLRENGWQISKKIVCVVLGQPASIFVTRINHS